MRIAMPNGDVFECHRERLEAASRHRPDTGWRFVDANGHEHRWYAGGKPADGYRAGVSYETPSLVWVKDGEEWFDDDDEPHAFGHHECATCGERVEPGYKADEHRVYMPGPASWFINGQSVDEAEFRQRVKAAAAGWQGSAGSAENQAETGQNSRAD